MIHRGNVVLFGCHLTSGTTEDNDKMKTKTYDRPVLCQSLCHADMVLLLLIEGLYNRITGSILFIEILPTFIIMKTS